MASLLVNRSPQPWFGGRTGSAARRALGFALGVTVGMGLVLLVWPTPVAVAPPNETDRIIAPPTVTGVVYAPLPEAVERARASTVALEYGGGDAFKVATGVVVDEQGGVLSVKIDPPAGTGKIWAIDAAGRRRVARWVAADPETGLSLLEVDAADCVPIRPAARAATLGEEVFLIGNPYGLAHSVGRGFIAGLHRRLDLAPHPLSGLIQVQAPIHPGDNGALLADLRGEWLGLVRGGLAMPESRNPSADHDLGFAIPADEALWIAGRLRSLGTVDRAYLGIHLGGDRPELPGASVLSVVPDAPAAKAGLVAKDHITALADRPIRSGDELTDRLDRLAAGTMVTLNYLRDSVPLVATVCLGSRPDTRTATVPAPEATPPPAEPARPVVPRELLDQIDRLQREVEELQRRSRSMP